MYIQPTGFMYIFHKQYWNVVQDPWRGKGEKFLCIPVMSHGAGAPQSTDRIATLIFFLLLLLGKKHLLQEVHVSSAINQNMIYILDWQGNNIYLIHRYKMLNSGLTLKSWQVGTDQAWFIYSCWVFIQSKLLICVWGAKVREWWNKWHRLVREKQTEWQETFFPV